MNARLDDRNGRHSSAREAHSDLDHLRRFYDLLDELGKALIANPCLTLALA